MIFDYLNALLSINFGLTGRRYQERQAQESSQQAFIEYQGWLPSVSDSKFHNKEFNGFMFTSLCPFIRADVRNDKPKLF